MRIILEPVNFRWSSQNVAIKFNLYIELRHQINNGLLLLYPLGIIDVGGKPFEGHCRFWCQGIAQKFFRTVDTSFDTKMMVKSGAIEIVFKFHKIFQSDLLTGPA